MADSNAMYSSALLYQAMLMLLMCIVFILVWSRGCRHNILEELRAPLLPEETPEHRIDAATRAAEDGFARCGGCTFENFKRFSHCAICGDALAVTTSSTEPDQEPVMAAASTTKTVSARQLRARKRKEWTRRLNGDGSFSWERSPVEDASGGVWSAPPGFIVQFKTEKPDHDDENRVATAETTLAEELVAPRLLLVDALDADAASFPTGQSVDTDNDRRAELARMTTLDFPSKYAHFVVSTASLVVPAEVEFLKLSVHRDFLLEESIDHMCCIQEKNMKSVMRINFLDERAVDAGGVQREWMLLLTELLVDSELQLFVCRNRSDQSFYLNPVSLQDVGDEHLKYYFAVGRLIGRVLLEGSVWGFHFSVPLLKMILGQPVSFDDLQSCDPDLHRNLRWLLENDGAESLGLDFSVNEKTRCGETVVVDLIAGGRDIPVTDENKLLYVERLFKYVLFDSVGLQLHALLKGVYEVIPHDLLMLYDVEEFDYLLCGTDEIDVEDWRAHSKQSLNLNGTRVVDWFWEEVAAMSPEYRRRLLVFATGSSRVPLAGFRGLTSYDGRLCPFTLKGVSTTSDKYIVSHACFNRLDLPLYKTKAELHTVLYAILDGDVYGFTSA